MQALLGKRDAPFGHAALLCTEPAGSHRLPCNPGNPFAAGLNPELCASCRCSLLAVSPSRAQRAVFYVSGGERAAGPRAALGVVLRLNGALTLWRKGRWPRGVC